MKLDIYDGKLCLSHSEVGAVISYIYAHCRTAAPNGKGYKVWEKMYAFQNYQDDGDDSQLTELLGELNGKNN